MFSYYGAKTNIIKYYPRPEYDHIIEPFAGSARYALKYWDREITLVDKWDVITGIWKFLQQASASDILSLPIPNGTVTVDDLRYDCVDAKNFVGFVISFAKTYPARKQNEGWAQQRLGWPIVQNNLKRIAGNLHKIRHWKIVTGSYDDIPNTTATWFIDPPYISAGHKYKHGSRNIDYAHLAAWVKNRKGQVIACEKQGADWLPFEPLCTHRGAKGNQVELMYSNSKDFPRQLSLPLF